MKRAIIAVGLLAPALALAQPKAAVVTDQVEAVVTVTKVDPKARTVTFRGPKVQRELRAISSEQRAVHECSHHVLGIHRNRHRNAQRASDLFVLLQQDVEH